MMYLDLLAQLATDRQAELRKSARAAHLERTLAAGNQRPALARAELTGQRECCLSAECLRAA